MSISIINPYFLQFVNPQRVYNQSKRSYRPNSNERPKKSYRLDCCDPGVSAWDTNSTRLLTREVLAFLRSLAQCAEKLLERSQDDTPLWRFERKRVREADRKRTSASFDV